MDYVEEQKSLREDIQLTEYMREYKKNVENDFLKEYDQELIDNRYKERQLYEKQHSKLPETLEYQFFDTRHSSIIFDDLQIKQLREAFEKFDDNNSGVMEVKRLK